LGPESHSGALQLIDGRAKTFKTIFPAETAGVSPDTKSYPDCPGPPNMAGFTAHGISLRPSGPVEDHSYKLLAINHSREAVEVFTVQETEQEPDITWVGCVIMPQNTSTNSVAALPDGGFVATKMFDPTKEGALADVRAGKISGLVYEWSPKSGFSVVPGSAMSAPNGIEVSPDGKWVYVAAFGSRELVKLSRDGSAPGHEAIAVTFSADNLRWTKDGHLLVAGTRPAGPDCQGDDCGGWTVVSWDPEAMTTTTLLSYPGTSPITGVSVATEALGYLWIGSFNDNQLGYIPVGE
jgi:DNA-binding beta-propeller fold protein YncE